MSHILQALSMAATNELSHPYFEKREVKKQTLAIVTSDRGLCGAFNSSIIRAAQEWLADKDKDRVELVCVGRRGFLFFRRRKWRIVSSYNDFNATMDMKAVRELVHYLSNRFVEEQTDEIYLLYTKFISTARVKVTLEKYLNIDKPETVEGAAASDYIFEPDPEAIFSALLPRYALIRLQAALADSFASEHATRMLAMTNATNNAGEMIDFLTLQYNKARQAAITKEILEVVSGAEALAG
jgi:F-type H+-transporting ATPase subunit gamma